MTTQTRLWLTLAALSGLIAVAAGAFGAHGVTDLKAKEWLRTGAEYQMVHALAVFACFTVWRTGAGAAQIAAWLFLIGATLFAGSLYLMAAIPQRPLALVLATPLGGTFMLAGWATLAWAILAGTRSAPLT